MTFHRSISALFVAIGFLTSAVQSAEHWPPITITDDMRLVGSRVVQTWIESPVQKVYPASHEAFGAYLRRGKTGICKENDGRRFDSSGVVPLIVRPNGTLHSHPIMTAQCGLAAYNNWMETGEGADVALRIADGLIALQDERGAFPYDFPWKHYLSGELQPGWTSAMAQGQAMSLFARAWKISKEHKYVEAGEKALEYMLTPTSEGGVETTLESLDPSLSNYVFFEEYVSNPANYVLNGYMFALLGLYDWSQIDQSIDANQDEAKDAFTSGIRTLEKILPYYDYGNISSYDLGNYTFGKRSKVVAGYHIIHTIQLRVLFELSGSTVLEQYYDKWLGYILDPHTNSVHYDREIANNKEKGQY